MYMLYSHLLKRKYSLEQCIVSVCLGHPHMYDEWHEQFDLEQCKGEISELLVNKPKVRALYTNLVRFVSF